MLPRRVGSFERAPLHAIHPCHGWVYAMVADVIKFDQVATQYDRDRNVFRMRVVGIPRAEIAKRLECTIEQVDASIVRMTGSIPPELRTRTIMLELERLDAIQAAFWPQALGGKDDAGVEHKPDIEAAGVVLRVAERRARLLGLDAQVRGTGALDDLMPKETSSERLRRVLDQIVGKPAPATIDAEVVPEG